MLIQHETFIGLIVYLFIFFPFSSCSADLQKAIDSENYALAADIRDQISKLEAESLAASAKALAFENARFAFRLGQKVNHKIFGNNMPFIA